MVLVTAIKSSATGLASGTDVAKKGFEVVVEGTCVVNDLFIQKDIGNSSSRDKEANNIE